jgi:hypothetical protein
MHEVCPAVQLFWQTVLHEASGSIPPHESPPGHVEGEATRQPFMSFAQVASVCAFSHTVPTSVH